MPESRVLVVRHGETEWSAERRHTGRTDLALTSDGEAQARRLAPRLPLDGVVGIWCSPLRRALDTARLAGLAVDRVEPDLREWDYGDAEGRTTEEMRAERPEWSVWESELEGGESLADVGVRVDRVIATARSVDGTTVLVSHAHCLRILAARWIGQPPIDGRGLTLDPAGWGLLGWERETPVIERWNPPTGTG